MLILDEAAAQFFFLISSKIKRGVIRKKRDKKAVELTQSIVDTYQPESVEGMQNALTGSTRKSLPILGIKKKYL